MRRHAIVPDVITRCAVVGGACENKRPVASAGLTSFTSDAKTCHRTGCDHPLCSCRRRVRKRPVASAGPTSFTSDARTRHRAGCDHPLCSCRRHVASAGLTSFTSDAETCHRAGCDQKVACPRNDSPRRRVPGQVGLRSPPTYPGVSLVQWGRSFLQTTG